MSRNAASGAGARRRHSLLDPNAYAGLAKEVALGALAVATYPLGLVPSRLTVAPYRPEGLGGRSLLSHDPACALTPIILVHGYVHNRSAFAVMTRALRRAGFLSVHGLNYNPLTATLDKLAARLGEQVEQAMDAAGAPSCQIVGHSMGGIIARHYAQELAAAGTVDTVVTIGTPHRGTHAARLGAGKAAAALRPGSGYMRRLEENARPSETRWISYYSDLDVMVVPRSSAKLVHPALRATNVQVRNTGHLSLLRSPEVVGGVIRYLADRSLDRPGNRQGNSATLTPAATAAGESA